MNINKLIIDTLSSFNMPIRYRSYSGNESSYITFFELNNLDDEFSNDEEEC